MWNQRNGIEWELRAHKKRNAEDWKSKLDELKKGEVLERNYFENLSCKHFKKQTKKVKRQKSNANQTNKQKKMSVNWNEKGKQMQQIKWIKKKYKRESKKEKKWVMKDCLSIVIICRIMWDEWVTVLR